MGFYPMVKEGIIESITKLSRQKDFNVDVPLGIGKSLWRKQV